MSGKNLTPSILLIWLSDPQSVGALDPPTGTSVKMTHPSLFQKESSRVSSNVFGIQFMSTFFLLVIIARKLVNLTVFIKLSIMVG